MQTNGSHHEHKGAPATSLGLNRAPTNCQRSGTSLPLAAARAAWESRQWPSISRWHSSGPVAM